MKFLLVLVVVLAGVWLWRRGRVKDITRRPPPAPPAAPAPAQVPSAMVACTLCGLHLPASDAVTGSQGPYCCNDHRRLREGDA